MLIIRRAKSRFVYFNRSSNDLSLKYGLLFYQNHVQVGFELLSRNSKDAVIQDIEELVLVCTLWISAFRHMPWYEVDEMPNGSDA